ncbi:MAG: hypothetical protein JWR85_1198 [Marmoricola sp.]|nr:hypothetical protein [Marmoricola sp.]
MTSAGWAVLGLAVTGWALGAPLGWTELRYLGASASLVLLVGLVTVLVPRGATATVTARPERTAVGSTTTIELDVRTRMLPVASPLVRLEGDVAPQVLRMRTLVPGRTRQESFEQVAARRGIFTLGPVLHTQSDLLGLFQRTRRWGEPSTLWVRPRVVVPETFSLGGVFDLEGLPSDQLSKNDLAFHALREYVAGDDLRQVHWRSSAKAGSLLVRQYLESRSLNAAVVVDDDPSAYADDEEFETAVSIAASLAIRALTDGFEVSVACGGRTSEPAGRGALLDECSTWALADRARAPVDIVQRTRHLARTGTSIGVGVVVSGSTCDLESLLEATTTFGGYAQRTAVRVDPAGEGGVLDSHGVRVLELTRLEQLPLLAAWTAT